MANEKYKPQIPDIMEPLLAFFFDTLKNDIPELLDILKN